MRIKIRKDWAEIAYVNKKESAHYLKAIERVREIHMRFWLDEPYCSECHSYEIDEKYASYPCPTIRALDGDV